MNSLVPIDELNDASEDAQPGDVIRIENGTYSNKSITINANGTQQNRITIKAETPGQVILTGTSSLRINGSYTTIANLVFQDGGTNKAIRLDGEHNRLCSCEMSYSADVEKFVQVGGLYARVDHCVFRDHTGVGVYLVVDRQEDIENYALIDHNVFKDRPEVEDETNDMEAIRLGYSGTSLSNSKTIIEYNYFENCDGEMEIISVKACENILRYNEFINSNGTLTLRHGNRNIVANNKFDGQNKSNSGGIRIIGEDHRILDNLFQNLVGNERNRVAISFNCGVSNSPLNKYFQVKRAEIDGNVSIQCKTTFAIGYVKDEAVLKPIESIITNSIVYSTTSDGVFSEHEECIGSDDMFYENNICYATNLGSVNGVGVIQETPTNFDSSLYDESNYGTDGNYGLIYNVEPEDSELPISVDEYYNNVINEYNDSPPDNEEIKKIKEDILDLQDDILDIQSNMTNIQNDITDIKQILNDSIADEFLFEMYDLLRNLIEPS